MTPPVAIESPNTGLPDVGAPLPIAEEPSNQALADMVLLGIGDVAGDAIDSDGAAAVIEIVLVSVGDIAVATVAVVI